MIKKIIVTTISLFSVVCILGTNNSYAAEKMGTITASTLNVRSGPSSKYRVVGKLNRGNNVTIVDSSGGWVKVKFSGDKTGWSSSKYVKGSDTSTEVKNNTAVKNSSTNIQNKSVKVVATAYTGYSTTSTGQKPVWGTIAVDPKVIPYGTKVYIPYFDRVFIANNTGGAIKGNKIDIYMNSKKECRNWGRKTIEIRIIK